MKIHLNIQYENIPDAMHKKRKHLYIIKSYVIIENAYDEISSEFSDAFSEY